jgi:hypothetical protein
MPITSVSSSQDLSHICVKCGSKNVVSQSPILVEWAPLWATYLASVGISTPYRKLVRKIAFVGGYCKKHSPKPILKRLVGYLLLLLGCISIFFGIQIDNGWLMTLAFVFWFAFLFLVSISTPIKASKIEGEVAYLEKPIP